MLCRDHAWEVLALDVDDIASVAALAAAWGYPAWTESYLRHARTDERTYLRGAYVAGEHKLGGFIDVSCVFNEFEILLLVVDPNFRRRGCARALMQHLMTYAAAQDAVVFLEVRASNQAAMGLYQQFGFEYQHTRYNYYQDPNEDARVLARKP